MKWKYDKSNLTMSNNNFNWILTIIFGIMYLFFPYGISKFLFGVIIFADLFYYLVFMRPKAVKEVVDEK